MLLCACYCYTELVGAVIITLVLAFFYECLKTLRDLLMSHEQRKSLRNKNTAVAVQYSDEKKVDLEKSIRYVSVLLELP